MKRIIRYAANGIIILLFAWAHVFTAIHLYVNGLERYPPPIVVLIVTIWAGVALILVIGALQAFIFWLWECGPE